MSTASFVAIAAGLLLTSGIGVWLVLAAVDYIHRP